MRQNDWSISYFFIILVYELIITDYIHIRILNVYLTNKLLLKDKLVNIFIYFLFKSIKKYANNNWMNTYVWLLNYQINIKFLIIKLMFELPRL